MDVEVDLDLVLHDPREIVAAMAIGTVVGAVSARLVHMTAMPQMVALFNGVGGGAAALVALLELEVVVDTGAADAVGRTVRINGDSFVIVEAGVPIPAEGEPGPTSPEPMNSVVQGVVPYAAANPIFVDVGGDGYTPPGLPAPAGPYEPRPVWAVHC